MTYNNLEYNLKSTILLNEEKFYKLQGFFAFCLS